MGAVALRIFCALALLAVGLAHRMPEAVAAVPLDLSRYVLPDGTLPVICVTDTGADRDSHGKSHVAASDCEACRIAQAALPVPPATEITLPVRVVPAPVHPLKAEAFYRQLFPPNAAPRAPPAGPLQA